MAQTNILVAGNTALRSDSVVVGSTPVALSIYQAVGGVATGGAIQRGVQLALERLVDGQWQPEPDGCGSFVYLTDKDPSITIYGPGTYSLYRTVNAALQIGAVKDEA